MDNGSAEVQELLPLPFHVKPVWHSAASIAETWLLVLGLSCTVEHT